MTFTVDEVHTGEGIVLRRFRKADATALKESMEASYKELHDWMPWAQAYPTDESVREYVDKSAMEFGGDQPANFAITLSKDERIIGSCGLMPRPEIDVLEIGYWVDSRFTGRGIATEAARLLTSAAFAIEQITRVQISCDQANVRSAAIPRRLGYLLDRVEVSTQIWLKQRAV